MPILDKNRNIYYSEDGSHPSILTDEIVSYRDKNEVVSFMFRLPSCSKKRAQAVIRMPLSSTVRQVRKELQEQEDFEAGEDSVEFWLEGGTMDLDDEMSKYAIGGFVPLIMVRGGYHDITVTTGSSLSSMSMRWNVHSTLSDLLTSIHSRLCSTTKRPTDPGLMRLTYNDKILPLEQCYRLNQGTVDSNATLYDIGLTTSEDQPCTVKFRRSQDGKPKIIILPMTGSATIKKVTESVLNMQMKEQERFFDDGWVAGVLRPNKQSLANSESKKSISYDDEDETISPCGIHEVYLRTPNSVGYQPCADLERGVSYLTFHPPPLTLSAVDDGMLRFISINDNYLIPHLSDLGLCPGCSVDLSFWNPSDRIWSSEVQHPDHPDKTEISIAIKKSGLSTSVIKIPLSPIHTSQEILNLIWCMTGIGTHEALLSDEEGRTLHPLDTMLSTGLLPESGLVCVIPPKPWE